MKKTAAVALCLTAALTAALAVSAPAEETGWLYEDDNLKIGQYKGLTYSVQKEEVTDEDVEEEMLDSLSYYSDYEHLMDVQAADGDLVNVDYECTIDGEEYEDYGDTDTLISIGDELYPEGFEEGIIGMTPGETKEVEVVFPEDYEEGVAGKTAVYSITLNFICGEEVTPELTDESLKEYMDVDSVEEYREQTRAELEEESETLFVYQREDEILEALMENCEVKEVPEELIVEDVEAWLEQYKAFAEMFGMDFEDYIGGDEKDFKKEMEEEARLYESQNLVLEKIAELENLTVSDEEFEEYLVQLAEDYGFESVEELKEAMEAETGAAESHRQGLLLEKVKNFLYENAVYVEAEEEPDLEFDEDELLEWEDGEELVWDDEEALDEELDMSEILVEETTEAETK